MRLVIAADKQHPAPLADDVCNRSHVLTRHSGSHSQIVSAMRKPVNSAEMREYKSHLALFQDRNGVRSYQSVVFADVLSVIHRAHVADPSDKRFWHPVSLCSLQMLGRSSPQDR